MLRTRAAELRRLHPAEKKRRRRHQLIERLEERVLLSSTLFVTPASVAPDATHFQTLQDAPAAAVAGDKVILQSGFSMGTFRSTHLSAAAVAGSTSIRTIDALSIGEVVSIGTTTTVDPMERALVVGVNATGSGDYLITLGSALKNNHSGSLVDATNASSVGKTIGLWKEITLTAEAAVVMPFSLDIWAGTTGVTLSNLNLTSGAATSVWIEGDGNTLSNVAIGNQLTLTGAHNNTMSGLTVGNRIFVDAGSWGNTVSGSALHQVNLRPGSHGNSFTSSAIGGVVALGDNSSSGGDSFTNDAFTGTVKIAGNLAAATNDVFSGNSFTIGSGDGLTLLYADGTLVSGNHFTINSSFTHAIVVADSARVVVDSNTATLAHGTGLFIYSELDFVTSVDVTNNAFASGDGDGLCISKWDATAMLEVRVQGNDLRNNAVGAIVYGDGTSAGNIDLGGGSTVIGAGLGKNDFSSYLVADDWHFAIGLAGTSADYTLLANGNKWGVQDPMAVVADDTHDVIAAGTGTIIATAPAPQETLTLTPRSLSVVQTGITSGLVAHFSSNLAHGISDFTATIAWGDGTSSSGTIAASAGGGFDILASRSWNTAGTFTMTISLVSNAGATAQGSAAVSVAPRVLTATAANITAEKGSTFRGTVGTFTDNLPAPAIGYVVTIHWSDGMVTAGVVTQNSDGTFSISTTRAFTAMGTLTATISIETADPLFTATSTFLTDIATKSGKVPPGKVK